MVIDFINVITVCLKQYISQWNDTEKEVQSLTIENEIKGVDFWEGFYFSGTSFVSL